MPVEIDCDTCDETFEVDPYRADTARFCSNDCRATWQSGEYEGSGGPNYQGKKETFECKYCGDNFEEWPSQNSTTYCSSECYRQWQKYHSPISLTLSGNGYPMVASNNGKTPLHRLLATLLVDDIRELRDKHVHHSEIPIWYERKDEVNIAVTYLDNLEVKTASEHSKHHHKTDPRKGEDVGTSVLTESDVREIRTKYETGDYTYADLSEQYSTAKTNISMIVNRETWDHVE